MGEQTPTPRYIEIREVANGFYIKIGIAETCAVQEFVANTAEQVRDIVYNNLPKG